MNHNSNPQDVIQYSQWGERRTSIRHRLARATVIMFDALVPTAILLSATFRDAKLAAAFAAQLAADNKDAAVVTLNALGEATETIATNEHLRGLAARMAERLWTRSAPPRHTPRPLQTTLPFYSAIKPDSRPQPTSQSPPLKGTVTSCWATRRRW